MEIKAENIVLTFSAAAYEMIKISTYKYVDTHPILHCSKLIDRKRKSKKPKQELVMDESLSIKHRAGNSQIYRINLYPTTCRTDINGKQYLKFLQNDLPPISDVFLQNCDICEQALEVFKADKATPKQSSINHNQSTHQPLVIPNNKRLEWTPIQSESRVPEIDEELRNPQHCPLCLRVAKLELSIQCRTCERVLHLRCEHRDEKEDEEYICNETKKHAKNTE